MTSHLEIRRGGAGSPTTPQRLRGPAALLRTAILRRLSDLDGGILVWEDRWLGETRTFGHGMAGHRARIQIESPDFYRALLWRGPLGVAEAHMDGCWRSPGLETLLRLLLGNPKILRGVDRGAARVFGGLLRVLHRLKDNTLSGSRRNIAAHYDLGNEFFESFLDPSMTYSSGRYADPATSLAEAQEAKLDAICQHLALQKGDHLLEVGSGWGSFAIHAARHYGCRVTSTTISKAQFELARRRIEQAGLGDQITLLLEDYRCLEGRFDKIASIEMVEAVGDRHLETWFRHLGRLLTPRGRVAIQAITIADQAFDAALRRVDFIKRYIFPGSFIPSGTRLLAAATAGSDLRLRFFEDFGLDYARTLRDWRQAFVDQEASQVGLGLDPSFRRMWDYYLSYCAAGFAEGYLGVAHLVFDKPGARRDRVR